MAVRRSSRVLLVALFVGALDVHGSLDIPSDVGGILKGGFPGKKLVNASLAEVNQALRQHKHRITGAVERLSQGVRQGAITPMGDEAAKALDPDGVGRATGLDAAAARLAGTAEARARGIGSELHSVVAAPNASSGQIAERSPEAPAQASARLSVGTGSGFGEERSAQGAEFAGALEAVEADPSLGIARAPSMAIAGVALLAVSGLVGYVLANKLRGRSQRSPMLLSDALDTSGGGSARTPALQMTNQEPYFSQF
eukprot:CAMPEP_0176186110 /NCGR_PEP_ID=MMETSP0121_2-20121125/1698_1 /TAXON_ID=160619 /ORGANISM="Kryptoperidinium foliaceum, Strain CCMP 1326" /LENGTH=254 /DNA_ID=CAMNT_0017524579 /DNA_START=38 /DNA_END=803 /DNA_ORIENTATION=+